MNTLFFFSINNLNTNFFHLFFYVILFLVIEMKKVLIIGSTVCDIIMNLDHLPVTQEDVHPYSQSTRIGGCAFNAAHVIAHMGVPYSFISPIGTGVYGDFVRKEIKKQNVDTEIFVEGENGSCLCFVEKGGERTFLSMHGVEYSFDPSWLSKLDMSEYEYGYVCGLEIEDKDGQCLTDTICHLPVQFLFAPGPRIMSIQSERLHQLLNHGVMLHLNENEAKSITQTNTVEQAAEKLYQKTGNLVIVTAGHKGCYIKKEDAFWMGSESVNVVNTIGAGDSHAGAFLAALAQGKTLKECAEFANSVAAKVVAGETSTLSNEDYERLKNCR